MELFLSAFSTSTLEIRLFTHISITEHGLEFRTTAVERKGIIITSWWLRWVGKFVGCELTNCLLTIGSYILKRCGGPVAAVLG